MWNRRTVSDEPRIPINRTKKSDIIDTIFIPIIIKDKIKKKKRKWYTAEFRIISKQLRTQCSDCWSLSLLQVHHIDKDKKNNSLDNLVCLCFYCHAKYHKHMQNRNPPVWLK